MQLPVYLASGVYYEGESSQTAVPFFASACAESDLVENSHSHLYDKHKIIFCTGISPYIITLATTTVPALRHSHTE